MLISAHYLSIVRIKKEQTKPSATHLLYASPAIFSYSISYWQSMQLIYKSWSPILKPWTSRFWMVTDNTVQWKQLPLERLIILKSHFKFKMVLVLTQPLIWTKHFSNVKQRWSFNRKSVWILDLHIFMIIGSCNRWKIWMWSSKCTHGRLLS